MNWKFWKATNKPSAVEQLSQIRLLLHCVRHAMLRQYEHHRADLEKEFQESHRIMRESGSDGGASFYVELAEILDQLELGHSSFYFSRIYLLFEGKFLENAVTALADSEHPYGEYVHSLAIAMVPALSIDQDTWTSDSVNPRWIRVYLGNPLRDIVNSITHPSTDIHFRIKEEEPDQLSVMVIPSAISE